jgi:hypothetical protein
MLGEIKFIATKEGIFFDNSTLGLLNLMQKIKGVCGRKIVLKPFSPASHSLRRSRRRGGWDIECKIGAEIPNFTLKYPKRKT